MRKAGARGYVALSEEGREGGREGSCQHYAATACRGWSSEEAHRRNFFLISLLGIFLINGIHYSDFVCIFNFFDLFTMDFFYKRSIIHYSDFVCMRDEDRGLTSRRRWRASAKRTLFLWIHKSNFVFIGNCFYGSLTRPGTRCGLARMTQRARPRVVATPSGDP